MFDNFIYTKFLLAAETIFNKILSETNQTFPT